MVSVRAVAVPPFTCTVAEATATLSSTVPATARSPVAVAPLVAAVAVGAVTVREGAMASAPGRITVADGVAPAAAEPVTAVKPVRPTEKLRGVYWAFGVIVMVTEAVLTPAAKEIGATEDTLGAVAVPSVAVSVAVTALTGLVRVRFSVTVVAPRAACTELAAKLMALATFALLKVSEPSELRRKVPSSVPGLPGVPGTILYKSSVWLGRPSMVGSNTPKLGPPETNDAQLLGDVFVCTTAVLVSVAVKPLIIVRIEDVVPPWVVELALSHGVD